MSLQIAAQHLASRGRGPDTTLVHMSNKEVQGLQALAASQGGSLSINPDTGLVEAGFLDKFLPAIAGAALNYFAPGIGTAIGGALGLSGAAGSAIAIGGLTGLASGDLTKGIMTGLGAYGGAGLQESLMGTGAGILGSGAGASGSAVNQAAAQALAAADTLTNLAPTASATATTGAAGSIGSAAPAVNNLSSYVAPQVSETLATAMPSEAAIAYTPSAEMMAGSNAANVYAAPSNIDALKAGYGSATGSWDAAKNFAKDNSSMLMAAAAPALFGDISQGGLGDIPKRTGTIRPFNVTRKQTPYTAGDEYSSKQRQWFEPTQVTALPTTTVNLAEGGSTVGRSNPYLMTPEKYAQLHPPVTEMPVIERPITTFPITPPPATTPPVTTNKKYKDFVGKDGKTYTYDTTLKHWVVKTPATSVAPVTGGGGLTDLNGGGGDGIGGGNTGGTNDGTGPGLATMGMDAIASAAQALGLATAPAPATGLAPVSDAVSTPVSPDAIAAANAVAAANDAISESQAQAAVDAMNASNDAAAVSDTGVGTASSPGLGVDGIGSDGGGGGGGGGNGASGSGTGVGGIGSSYAIGGITNFAQGGLGSLGGYSDGGQLLRGPGDGVSDNIPATIGDNQPARLADGEFVVPARIVSELGNGSTEAGARQLYKMLDRIQANRSKSIGKGKVAADTKAVRHLPA